MGTQPHHQKVVEPPIFSPIHCGQTAAWIKIPLGTKVGLGLHDIVFDGDQAPPPLKGHSLPPIFGQCPLWPNCWMSKMPLVMEVDLDPGDVVFDGDPATPRKKGTMSIVAKRLDG